MQTIINQLPSFFTYYNVMLLLWGIGSTLLLTAIGCSAGFLFGSLIAFVRTTRSAWLFPLKAAMIAYVEFFRRIPFLVILFIVLFAAQVILPTISLFGIAAISVCLLSTAYLSEIIRAGIDSVQRPQIEAAEVMNFSRWRTMWEVILPQAWKVILPPATSFVIMFIKDTSLASQMGVTELMFTGKILANRGFSGLLVYTVILLCYFAISYPLSRFAAWMENKLATSNRKKSSGVVRPDAGFAGFQPYN
ncbi:MAG: amino acid ABC transporter permease [Rhizobiaceae bacterium]|nr:amino acid ABC transporter permease [Rhizobiaceae bacterium]